MRIAIAHYYWDYPESEYDLPSALVRRGNQVVLTVWSGDPRASRSYDINGFHVHMLPGLNMASPLRRLNLKNPYISGVGSVYDSFSPEVIDCQSQLFLTTAISQREARDRKIPSVVTVRGVMAKRGFIVNSAQRLYLYTVATKIFKDAALVRCLTESDAKEIQRFGCPQKKVRVVPNFVDTATFLPSGEEGDSILWYGRFVEEKGLECLVRAARRVIERRSNLRFVLGGDGPLRQPIRSMVESLGMGGNFSIPGKLDRAGVLKLLSESSIALMPSIKEGMPFSLLEAMSSEKAMIASDIAGINDIIKDGENGLLVPPNNAAALADSIEALLRDPSLRRSLGKRARQTILEKYSEDVVVGRIEAIYQEARATAS